MNIHVVRSVKGGSGKTCFALHKALELTGVELHPASGDSGTEPDPNMADHTGGKTGSGGSGSGEGGTPETGEELPPASEESTHDNDPSPDSGTGSGSDIASQSPDQTGSGASRYEEGGTPKSVVKTNKKVLYIDADVHASETMNMMVQTEGDKTPNCSGELYHILFEEEFSDLFKDNTRHPHTLNSYMHPYRGYISTFKDIIMHGQLHKVKGYCKYAKDCAKDSQLDFIFVDPTNRGRAVFENMYQSSGASAIGLGLYLAKMRTLLECASAAEYDEMIIDMPPGSDAFSSHLMELLTEFGGKDGRKLHVYYVAGSDINHIRSSAKAAIEQHLHLMRTKTPYNVCFVYNKVFDADTDNGGGFEFLDRKSAINIILHEIGYEYVSAEYELYRLNYYSMDRDKEYFYRVRRNDGLAVCFSYKEMISHII